MMCILYDQLLHPDNSLPIVQNQDYNDLMTIFKHRGMRTILQMYFMRLDPQMRMRYRLIREAFRNSNNMKDIIIEIRKDNLQEVPGKSIIRKTGDFISKIITLNLWRK
jgi:hypothetical protein